MAYSKNILPTEGAYYTANKATFSGGSIIFETGGQVSIELDETYLNLIPPSALFNFMVDTAINPYAPELLANLHIELKDGTKQNYTIFPVVNKDGVATCTVDMDDGEFYYCKFSITARKRCAVSLWEFCPQQESDVSTIIEGVKQSLPHVLYDYNTWQLEVEQAETSIGIISCVLQGNTDVNGHLSLDFYSSEYCNIYIRFKDNDVTELYAPLKFTVNPGLNTIGIPHAYLKRLAGPHNFVCTCQCTNGKITIYPRGLLYTIDAGHLAERALDVGIDVLDISIEQTKLGYEPERIWAIGRDAGEILVKAAPYGTTAKTAWEPRYSMGEGLSAAIEFDGDWHLNTDRKRYTILTEDQPFIFIIENNNDLVVYKGNDEATKLVLANNVSQVSVCKGYSSILYPEQDQGLVVCYIQDNKAYCLRYVYDVASETKIWLVPQLLCNELAEEVIISRLNDYRVSIQVKTATSNLWYISERTYVAQAAAIDTGYISLYDTNTFISIVGPNADLDGHPVVFDNPYDGQKEFYIEWNYPVSKHYSIENISDIVTVTLNGVVLKYEDKQYSVSLRNNRLYVNFVDEIKASRKSDTTLAIDIRYRSIILATNDTGFRYVVEAPLSFTWLFERRIETITYVYPPEHADTALINLTIRNVSIKPKALSEQVVAPQDIARVNLDGLFSVVAKEINKNTLPTREVATIDLSNTCSIVPLLVGPKPI